MFFPRGGSAHVTRALAHELPAHGWDVTLVTGSRASGHGDARRFFEDLDIRPVDFDAGYAPMHPSFEDRPGAHDRVFAAIDDAGFEAHVAAWSRVFDDAGAADHDVLHLHHLTPLHEAAARVAPDVPVVTHLHGTELLMLEEIADGAPWPYAQAWVRRMRRWAQRSERLLVLSPSQVDRAVDLLGIDPERCVVSPNGFDPERFDRLPVDRAAHWRAHLVDAPRGWAPGADEGSISYTLDDIAPLTGGGPVAICVSRFTAVKRLGLLVRAWARAQQAGDLPADASLVLLGGYPGEWEGEHPADAVAASGARNVFLGGWHDHQGLPSFLSTADVFVLASVREQFGSVLVEAMACGLPAIAVDRFGPADIVHDGVTGWLVEPDDEAQLAAALAGAIADPVERRRRGRRAWRDAHERFSWPSLAGDLALVLDEVAGGVADGRLTARTPTA
ncbi:D-inositol-3-phosphate glycosyltransferase [Baekduia alba]|uniref:glycosyltransferase family 4 protein n=1 Tax=Baekduia alba TaxID=2997333 RepID=UPI00233FDF00|nr:glycosyltransferase family 4 protein [Baekduia alba]WCB94167.1 D-inositol-3-phosphate glycosyltransferase [Baekduia alba]